MSICFASVTRRFPFATASCYLFIFVVTLLVLGPRPLFAQIDTGRVTGTVKDASGAVIAGSKLSLADQQTGIVRAVQSGGNGSYVFGDVKPGLYTLKAEKTGFQTSVNKGIDVHVQQAITQDITMQPGEVAQQVVVTSAAPLLQAQDASVGQTVDSRAINDLPLNGRNWASLGQLAAGVTTTTTSTPSGGNSGSAFFSANGVSLWQNDFRLNGIDDNVELYGGSQGGTNASVTPPPDAIQEFKLQTGDFSAEFGHSTGAVVNAVVKSGTNKLNGDLWEYFRNDKLDANDYFSNLRGLPKPEYRQNQFGGTVGGPVYIPKLYNGKDKTFFFFDYQGNRIITPASSTETVPTASMAASGFTNLQDLIKYTTGTVTDALGRTFPLATVFDPATTRLIAPGARDAVTGLSNSQSAAIYVRDPFYTGGSLMGKTDFTNAAPYLNQLPASRLNPNIVKLLGVYPAPTSPGFVNNFFYNPKSTQYTNQTDFRLDENFSEHDSLFGVFDWSHFANQHPPSLPGIADGQSFGTGLNDTPRYAVAISYTHTFTPTLINEARFGFDHTIQNVIPDEGNTLGIPGQFGIQGVPQVAGNGGLPAINISGLAGLGVAPYEPTISTIKSLEVTDNVTKVYGSHTFKTGIQVDRIEGDITQPPYGKGSFNYNGQYTSVVNRSAGFTGLADALLIPSAATVPGGINNLGGVSGFSGSNYAPNDDRRFYIGAYFQDDWKVTPKLTLNLGLRWDHTTPYAELQGRQANFIQTGNTGTYYLPNKTCNTPRSGSFDALLAKDQIRLACVAGLDVGTAQYLNFAPRVGFAYRFTQRAVVRGGYGIAYGALANIGFGGTLGNNYPFLYTFGFNSPTTTSPLLLPDGSVATVQNSLAQYSLQNPALVSGNGISLIGRQYNYQTPYTQTFNATVQYQLTPKDSVQAGYVGVLGRHLDSMVSQNAPTEILPPGTNNYQNVPFPDFGLYSAYETTQAISTYNSLQAVYQHQFSDGLSVLANYTLSRCNTDQRVITGSAPGYRASTLAGFGIQKDYGLCDTDATHVVHLSGTYQLPFGKGQRFMNNSNGFLQQALGGWAFNYIYTFQSGQPFTLGCPVGTTSDFGCFADVVPGANIYAGPHNQNQWLNPQAFANPSVATAVGQSNFSPLGGPPQQARGPGFNNLDFSVFKYFPIREAVRLQFRAEAFNLTNTAQFSNPGNLNFSNTVGFSQITSLRNNSRLLQFALKLFF